MNPDISVIVPVFNTEKYLKKCIESILNQEVKNIELILVNDGSSDNSGLICDDYSKKDSRIRVIHKENEGVSIARNIGIKNATGKYISFIDSDDWIDKEMYKEILNIFYTYNVDFVKCSAKRVYKDNVIKGPTHMDGGYYSKDKIESYIYPRIVISDNLATNAVVSASTCVYNRKFIDDNNIFFDEEMKHFEDLMFNVNIILKSSSFYYMIDNYFYNYTFNEESTSQKFNPQKWKYFRQSHKIMREKLIGNKEYDFSNQLDLFLINLAYISAEDARILDGYVNRYNYVKSIMNNKELIEAYKNVSIENISWKRKVLYMLIKYRFAHIYTMISYKSKLMNKINNLRRKKVTHE